MLHTFIIACRHFKLLSNNCKYSKQTIYSIVPSIVHNNINMEKLISIKNLWFLWWDKGILNWNLWLLEQRMLKYIINILILHRKNSMKIEFFRTLICQHLQRIGVEVWNNLMMPIPTARASPQFWLLAKIALAYIFGIAFTVKILWDNNKYIVFLRNVFQIKNDSTKILTKNNISVNKFNILKSVRTIQSMKKWNNLNCINCQHSIFDFLKFQQNIVQIKFVQHKIS